MFKKKNIQKLYPDLTFPTLDQWIQNQKKKHPELFIPPKTFELMKVFYDKGKNQEKYKDIIKSFEESFNEKELLLFEKSNQLGFYRFLFENSVELGSEEDQELMNREELPL